MVGKLLTLSYCRQDQLYLEIINNDEKLIYAVTTTLQTYKCWLTAAEQYYNQGINFYYNVEKYKEVIRLNPNYAAAYKAKIMF